MKHIKEPILYKIIRPIVSIFFLLYTPKYINKNVIPKEGRVILAGNHTSILDCIFLMSSTKRNIHFLAKIELFQGIKKFLFSNMGLIPVNRKIHDSRPLKESINYLENEEVIGIFPEGTLGRGSLLPFKKGAVKMSKESGAPIVPFVITGKYVLFSKNLKIEFLDPIYVKDNEIEVENNKLRFLIEEKLKGD